MNLVKYASLNQIYMLGSVQDTWVDTFPALKKLHCIPGKINYIIKQLKNIFKNIPNRFKRNY